MDHCDPEFPVSVSWVPWAFYLFNYLSFKGSHDESLPEDEARVEIREQMLQIQEWTTGFKT